MNDIKNFPEDSFLRIYHSTRDLSEAECQVVKEGLGQFMTMWASHETPVAGAFEILHNRFVVISADESKTQLSGCSKDSMTGAMREIGAKLGLDFVHAPPICFRQGDEIRAVARDEFSDLVEKGEVKADTVVFDLTILNVGPYKAGRFEVPASDCWHSRAYDLQAS